MAILTTTWKHRFMKWHGTEIHPEVLPIKVYQIKKEIHIIKQKDLKSYLEVWEMFKNYFKKKF